MAGPCLLGRRRLTLLLVLAAAVMAAVTSAAAASSTPAGKLLRPQAAGRLNRRQGQDDEAPVFGNGV